MRPYTQVLDRLRSVGLRPTRQRLALAKLLFEGEDRHFSAEQLHVEAMGADIRVSLATVYNTLHQFTEANLLQEVVVDSGCSYFDTNTTKHYHFFNGDSGELSDIPTHELAVSQLPKAPQGMEIERVDIVVRLAKAK